MEEVVSEKYCPWLLRVRLMKNFGTKLSFHRPQWQNESQFVFSSDALAGPLIEICNNLSKASVEEKDDDYDEVFPADAVDSHVCEENS